MFFCGTKCQQKGLGWKQKLPAIAKSWPYLLVLLLKDPLVFRTIKTFNNRNLYKQEDGENYLFFAAGQWNVGAEEPTDPQNPGNIGVKQKVMTSLALVHMWLQCNVKVPFKESE